MDGEVLKAAVTGDARLMKDLASQDPSVLLGTTPQGNTCLHIAAIHGHEVLCKEVQALKRSLLAAVNSDDKTPLLAAVASGRVSVASVLLRCCRDQQLSETILKQDKRGCNALHHAVRSGHRNLALELVEAEAALSHAVNQYGESPMFIAVMRDYEDVFRKLLEIPDSAYVGANGLNALHAAVRNGNSGEIRQVSSKLINQYS
jgi:ankyrin repeat protein